MTSQSDAPNAASLCLRNLQDVFERAGVYVFTKDSAGHYTYANTLVCELFGRPLEEIVGKDDSHFFDLDISNDLRLTDLRVLESGETVTTEERNIVKETGETRYYLSVKAPLRDEAGTIIGLFGTSTDITDNKRAQEQGAHANAMLAAALDSTIEGILVVDSGSAIERYNQRFLEIWDLTETDLQQRDGRALARRMLDAIGVQAGGEEGSWDLTAGADTVTFDELILQSGRFLERHSRPMWDGGQVAGRVWSFLDVTKSKAVELALRQNVSRLEGILAHSADAVFFCNPDGRLQYVNRRLCLLLDRPQDALLQCNLTELVRLETGTLGEVLQRIVQEGNVSQEMALLHRDGRPIAVEMNATRLPDGKLYGACRDITARLEAEESLRVAGMVYDNSSEAIMVTDADNTILAVNPAYTQMSGYLPEEVIGRNPRFQSSGRQGTRFYHDMWSHLNERGSWSGELWNKRKNGVLYAVQLSISTIYDERGAVYRRIALLTNITEKKRAEEIIWKQANFDTLTGLPNRRMLLDRLEQEISRSDRMKESMALLFVDLDRFKEVNDSLGHHVGDELLMEAARRLQHSVRASDTVARLGGDEFTVLLCQIRSRDVDKLAQGLIDRLSQPYFLGEEQVYASASVGIALYPDDASSREELMQFADQAMYLAKEQGRNRHAYFTRTLQEEAQQRIRLITELGTALERQQLKVYFQPIVELSTGAIFKAEALLRWQHPVLGLINPGTFIPLAEETGLIVPIGDWVFRESMRWVARWNTLTARPFQISVNKSPVQFRSTGGGASWAEELQAMGLSGSNLAVEITEGLLLNKDDRTGSRLLQFRDAGIQVSVDDFGTGYSALSYLKKFDVDVLKIDQSFVSNMVSDEADQALCEAIVVMAHKLGLRVVAEGVETAEQAALLQRIGCDFGQGYHFARPMAAEQFDALLRSTYRAAASHTGNEPA